MRLLWRRLVLRVTKRAIFNLIYKNSDVPFFGSPEQVFSPFDDGCRRRNIARDSACVIVPPRLVFHLHRRNTKHPVGCVERDVVADGGSSAAGYKHGVVGRDEAIRKHLQGFV